MLFSVEYGHHVTIIVYLWKRYRGLYKSHIDIERLQASFNIKMTLVQAAISIPQIYYNSHMVTILHRKQHIIK